MTTRHDTIRARVAAVLRPDPTSTRDLAGLAGVGYRQALDALLWMQQTERVAQVGRKARSMWRALSPAEASDAERRRANAARWARAEARGGGPSPQAPPAPQGGSASARPGAPDLLAPPSENPPEFFGSHTDKK